MIKHYSLRLKNKLDYKLNRKRGILGIIDLIDSNSYVIKIRDKSNLLFESLIQITNECNCSMHSPTRKVEFIEGSLFEEIINNLKKTGLHTVGETLLEIWKKYNFTAILSTNEQYPKKIKKLANKYKING